MLKHTTITYRGTDSEGHVRYQCDSCDCYFTNDVAPNLWTQWIEQDTRWAYRYCPCCGSGIDLPINQTTTKQ